MELSRRMKYGLIYMGTISIFRGVIGNNGSKVIQVHNKMSEPTCLRVRFGCTGRVVISYHLLVRGISSVIASYDRAVGRG